MTETPGLIVPIDLAAFCVGTIDAHEETVKFAGATTNYAVQTGSVDAFLGMNATRDLSQPPLWPLEQGVHLHWAMPDALTRADSSGPELDFPALPNRWLVTRMVIDGAQVAAKSWVVESDALSDSKPDGMNAPTLPVWEASNNAEQKRGFRYLGARRVLTAGSEDAPPTPGPGLEDAAGVKLSAVVSGDIAFAAFYPNCRNIFGFNDDLADIPVTAGKPVELMYVVTGWFADPAHDPLTGGATVQQLRERLRWTFAGPEAAPDYSLYSGLVQGVAWDPSRSYVGDKVPLPADVAIANSPAEALAAYFRGVEHPDLPIFERLFTLFEMGLLGTFKQPQPGQLAQLGELLHEAQFGVDNAGTTYTIIHPAPSSDPAGLDARDVAPRIPLQLGDELDLLNRYSQEADLAAWETDQYQTMLVADWYRLFLVASAQQNEAFNSFSTRRGQWPAIQQQASDTLSRAQAQKEKVQGMLGTDLVLEESAPPRFWHPAEPVVLIAGASVGVSSRHGGDGRFDPSGDLVCRLTTATVTALTLSAGTHVAADRFASVLPPHSTALSHPAVLDALLEEAALLNTSLIAAIAGASEAALAEGLQEWLAGTAVTGNPYEDLPGTLPSPVAVGWWAGENPWSSLLMRWQADVHPLMATTVAGKREEYAPQFFTGNYVVNPNAPGAIGYAPSGEGAIYVDPGSIDFDPANPSSGTAAYAGSALLSSTAADNLRKLLTDYLAGTADATLQAILDDLDKVDVVMQSLTGLNAALLTRSQGLQLMIGALSSAPLPWRTATQQAIKILGDPPPIQPVSPLFQGSYNPVRAGYAKFGLEVLNAYGQRRPIEVRNLYIAESLAAYPPASRSTSDTAVPVPGVTYLQPRLTQSARLLFRWLAADTTEYDEMNDLPTTSPVIGWLLPNHLFEGLFLYDRQGRPLGSLTLNEDASAVTWQATPGDDSTIGEGIEAVMAAENPHLRDVAVALSKATPALFRSFWEAVDRAAPLTAPAAPGTASGPAVLVGRPVALVQASLLLELQGFTAYNQSWSTLEPGNAYIDTDNGMSGVQFPVVLGDLNRIDDGLVGYFKQGSGGGYDLSTFYSEAADAGARAGVVRPSATNVTLTPTSNAVGSAPSVEEGRQKLLMLMDPRSGIHATTGILPTRFAQIPPDQFADILAGLEMTFLTTPVLRPAGGLTLPVPVPSGYAWSWIEEVPAPGSGSGAAWVVTPEIQAANVNAVWQYTPQTITEGWLRLNPRVLSFTLADAEGRPLVQRGASNDLTLTVANERRSAVTFVATTIVGEGTPPGGSIFYIHLGVLVEPSKVSSIVIEAENWTFEVLTDSRFGHYWAATPATGTLLTLDPGADFAVKLRGVEVATKAAQAQIYFDYYGVEGDSDGIDVATLAVQ